MQYLQSNNNGQKLLWKHSWTVELTENEMLVYNKVVHINRTINNVIKQQNSQFCLNLPTQKCLCGTTVTAHVAENKRRRAWQKNYMFVISEITWIFVTFIQNHFRNTCYLWYTTVTRTLRLFADVLNFLKICKYYTLSLMYVIAKSNLHVG